MDSNGIKSGNMIIVADAHVNQALGNHIPFFRMLDQLKRRDETIIFLGDIFDLWIALPRYEGEIHRRFLEWCRIQKKRRTVGFIEGNHEFFLSRRWKSCFTWCTDAAWQADGDGSVFCHGDRINREDLNYLRFRKISRNPVVKCIARLLPNGPRIAEKIKLHLKSTNASFRGCLPFDALRRFSREQCKDGCHSVFIGHFHHEYHEALEEGCSFHLLPDWLSSGKVTMCSGETQQVKSIRWQDI